MCGDRNNFKRLIERLASRQRRKKKSLNKKIRENQLT